MATGAAIVGSIGALAGMSSANRARKDAQAATALNAKQLQQTTDEEIRRQQYTHKRDIASIEAEIAGIGVSSTGAGLRAGGRTTTSVDADVSSIEGEIAAIKKEAEDERAKKAATSYDGEIKDEPMFTAALTAKLEEKNDKLEALKKQQQAELDIPWNEDGGIFAEYLSERERVNISEIAWMETTGLSSVKSTLAEGRMASSAASAKATQYAFQAASYGAEWWAASQPPQTTTTSVQS